MISLHVATVCASTSTAIFVCVCVFFCSYLCVLRMAQLHTTQQSAHEVIFSCACMFLCLCVLCMAHGGFHIFVYVCSCVCVSVCVLSIWQSCTQWHRCSTIVPCCDAETCHQPPRQWLPLVWQILKCSSSKYKILNKCWLTMRTLSNTSGLITTCGYHVF